MFFKDFCSSLAYLDHIYRLVYFGHDVALLAGCPRVVVVPLPLLQVLLQLLVLQGPAPHPLPQDHSVLHQRQEHQQDARQKPDLYSRH